jgi:hypothetical protein
MDEYSSVRLKVPQDLEPKLERQILEYNQLRELGEQFKGTGMLDPTLLT